MTTVPKMRDEDGTQGLRDLCSYIKKNYKNPIKTIIEIGSYAGESSVVFAKEFPDANIFCIDPWKSGYDDKDSASHSNFLEVEKAFDNKVASVTNIIKCKGTLEDYLSKDFVLGADMVYIDGNHSYEAVISDINNCKHIPVICGHDYYTDVKILDVHPHIAGVKKAVDEFFNSVHHVFKDSSWIVIR